MEELKNTTEPKTQEINVIDGFLISEDSAKKIVNMNNEYQFLKGYISGVATTFVGIGSGILVVFAVENGISAVRSVCRAIKEKKNSKSVVIINKEPEVVKNGNEELQSAE